VRIVIPAVEHLGRGWDDLRLLIASQQLYTNNPITVYYAGVIDRDVTECHGVEFYGVEFSQQRLANRNFGDCCRQIIEETDDEELLFLNDDTVLTPTTIKLLQEDIQLIRKEGVKVGAIGLRSNFSAGFQNIRRRLPSDPEDLPGLKWPSEDQIIFTPQIFASAFWIERKTLLDIPQDWTRLEWYGDNLLSYDLTQAGYQNAISRSYIHHVGSQSNNDYEKLDREGRGWLQKNRPDFYEVQFGQA
jgi:hypothetical protein